MAAFFTAATTELASSDFSLAASESATLYLTDASGANGVPADAVIDIQIKSAANEYFTVGSLLYQRPALVLTAVGTFRLFRHACSAAVGVDKN